jgi:hypothetical protein
MKLELESLRDGIPVLTDAAAGFYKENCMVCLHYGGHTSGVSLTTIYGKNQYGIEIHWSGEVTEHLLRAYADRNKVVDFGACAIALLLIRELTEYTAVEQSVIGTTIDYYLAPKSQVQDDILIFNNKIRLEVSGILSENEGNTVDSRIKDKRRRLKQLENDTTFIIVTEFSQP